MSEKQFDAITMTIEEKEEAIKVMESSELLHRYSGLEAVRFSYIIGGSSHPNNQVRYDTIEMMKKELLKRMNVKSYE